MKMMDMAEKPMNMAGEIPAEEKSRVHYPSFSVSGDKIPEELLNAKVGEMCRLVIIAKKTGHSEMSYDGGKERVELEIHKMGYAGNGKAIDEDEYEKLSADEKDKEDEKEIMGED